MFCSFYFILLLSIIQIVYILFDTLLYARLTSWFEYTQNYSIGEFASPTYYAVDLDCLMMGHLLFRFIFFYSFYFLLLLLLLYYTFVLFKDSDHSLSLHRYMTIKNPTIQGMLFISFLLLFCFKYFLLHIELLQKALDFFVLDISVSYFHPVSTIVGAQSRDYGFLYSEGSVNAYLYLSFLYIFISFYFFYI